jgi:hypothetical protein
MEFGSFSLINTFDQYENLVGTIVLIADFTRRVSGARLFHWQEVAT